MKFWDALYKYGAWWFWLVVVTAIGAVFYNTPLEWSVAAWWANLEKFLKSPVSEVKVDELLIAIALVVMVFSPRK
jgi:hypothetical protein